MRIALVTLPLALSFLPLVACSGSHDEEPTAATSNQSQALEAQAQDLFADPGSALFTVPATSLAGVSTWSFFGSSRGVTVQAIDADQNIQAEAVFLSDDSGTTLEGVGYAIQPGLGADAVTVVQALTADLHSAMGAGVSTASVHILGDPSSSCGGLLQAMGAGVIEWAGILVGGGIMLLTCPETVGLGCIAGGAIIVGGLAVGSAACNQAAQEAH